MIYLDSQFLFWLIGYSLWMVIDTNLAACYTEAVSSYQSLYTTV